MTFINQYEKLIFYNFPVILFSLIPFFLITGPFLSDLSISLISVLFFIYCLKKNNFSFFKNIYFYFFFIFWLYLLLNSLFNNFNTDSLKISFFYFRYGLFVIAIVSLLNFDDKFIKYFFYCIFVCFTVLTIDGFYQFITGENILGYKYTSSRISSFFGDKKILGSYLSRLWPIFFGLSIILFKKKNKFFLFFILIFILSEVLIFLSGDRTAFFFINLSAIIVILFSRKLRKLRLYTLLFSILILIVISFLNPKAKERVFDQTLKEMNILNGVKLFKGSGEKSSKNYNEIYIFSKAHHEIYISAYKIFLDNKFFGVGIKNFRKVCNDTKYYVSGKPRCFTHPHNSYLQLLTETGIIGFLFLVICLIYFCKYLIKHLILKFRGNFYFNDFEICILSGIAIYLWPFAPTGNFFNNWLNIALILNLPFLIWSRKSKNSITE